MKRVIMCIVTLALLGCSTMTGLATSAMGMGGAPPIDLTAQVGAENESNKLKLENNANTTIDEVDGDMVISNETIVNMTWWMIVLVWFSGILVNPNNIRGLFSRRRR